ncbi:hypothetical protein DICPUDRAFT_90956 [Dictyostelium purpureum]|uniref:Serine/threonine-protein phosphatase 2A activator n=1 Tax=Dictyostelium purpureum TaxID=5786 RepID=F1A609_DICPU|nr:uncharacterized protein DICPUDRAFT_90956 [Dictyostelium purpureum]EGC28373.1 hypothetical protein DICPUDRAFT_90956 [Dictyostelium purpureum]|eukprot:XP_003295103.1 hypothetical protein DICPUDRAFT_90956 [Dictyostelium purpureum]
MATEQQRQQLVEIKDIEQHKFVKPVKVVTCEDDIRKFLVSEACNNLLKYIQTISDQIKSKPNDIETPYFKSQPMRYGNKAYRTWYQKMTENIERVHLEMFGEESEKYKESIQELSPYLMDAMGNQTRLDYGTGHELHFVVWTFCLRRIGYLKSEDEIDIALKVFPCYLELVRKLQRVYGLEPAGTHGVWSLDDYQFIPFIWGAAQLINNPFGIKPASITIEKIVDQYYPKYMYLACIKYINTVKKGPFHEHSRDLFNISGAASWDKINMGMMKKFYADVLSKVPIIQHFLFGSLVSFSV